MLDQALLRDQFQQLLDRQRQAEGVYASLAADATDPGVREQAQQIQREKRKHILLTERMLEIVG